MTASPAPAPKTSWWKKLAAAIVAWARSPQGRRDIVLVATAAYTALHRAGL